MWMVRIICGSCQQKTPEGQFPEGSTIGLNHPSPKAIPKGLCGSWRVGDYLLISQFGNDS